MLEEKAIERGIDIEALKAEQSKLAKIVSLKDAFDFKLATKFAGVYTKTLGEEIIAAISILDEKLELVEDKYVTRPARFPYVPGFRAYRELPAMLACYNKLEEQPDVIFVEAQGIAHPRGLGLASHFGVSINKPTIGIAKSILEGEQKNDEVIIKGKVVAKALVTKKGSKPIYVSPGHMISLKTAVELTKRCLKEPHKLPEPIVQARKVANKVKEELNKA